MTTNTATTTSTVKGTGVRTTGTTTATAGKSRISATSPTKAQQSETTAKLTASQQKSLESLVKAVKDGVPQYVALDKAADDALVAARNVKVQVARAVARLMDHPATVGTRGTKAGQPALQKIATLTGYPTKTLEPLFKAATELRKAKLHTKTGDPSDREREIVGKAIKSEAEARATRRAKAGTKKAPVVKGGKITVEAISGQVSALVETLGKFTTDGTFTKDQSESLLAAIAEAQALVEAGTLK